MPRADHEGGQTAYSEDDYWTPTYRSRSLLHLEPSDRYRQAIDDSAAKTFAAMARRIFLSDDEGESEPSSQSSASLAGGVIKFQPIRREGSSSWKPTGISDLCDTNGSGQNDGNASSTAGDTERLAPVRTSAPSSVLATSPHESYNDTPTIKASASTRPEHRHRLTSGADTVGRAFNFVRSGQRSKEDNSTPGSNERHAELFGDLPDPIRLHEQLGEFDGQVVFIGHPNRDVSAHQWSAASFQWENIGRYAHSRGRVEGSLASDRVKGFETSRNTLLHFKLAAENREKLVVDNGRPKEANDPVRTTNTNVPRLATAYNISKSVAGEERDLDQGHASSAQPSKDTATATSVPLYDTVKRMHLDDPFVAKPNPQPSFPRANAADVKGSLDLRYEFPVKAATPTRPLILNATEADVEERESSIPSHGKRSYMRLARHALPEIGFGEEASSGPQVSVLQSSTLRGITKLSSPETVNSRQKSSKPVGAYGEHTKYWDATMQRRTAIPRFEGLQPTARSLFPPMGLTIANPHRVVSRLDPTAPAHTVVSTPGALLKVGGPDATATDLTAAAALQFSDPDGFRKTQEYEIANGLSKQPPTVQTFKGPFFTESMPTAHDPTLSLSVHVSEAEKLQKWFRDGHRPDRQREYARTLMSAAAIGSRKRHPGAIGEVTGIVHNETKNTLPFVRLYEGLSEYIEEHRNGSGGSYFTRAWTVASPQLRDLGPNGNNSFFSDAGGVPVEVRPRTSRWYEEDRAQYLSVFSFSGGMTERLSSHGTVGDGGLGLGKMGTRVITR
jgi:hypothetical protein